MLQIQPQINRARHPIPKILIPVSLSILIGYALATTYWSTSMQHRGTIIAHGCKVYLEDKVTENYEVSWSDIAVSGSLTQYRWIYNNGTGANIKWSHDAPSYLQLKKYYEKPQGTWNVWNTGTPLSFSQGEWLHIKIELTALADAINHVGAFQFKVYLELT